MISLLILSFSVTGYEGQTTGRTASIGVVSKQATLVHGNLVFGTRHNGTRTSEKMKIQVSLLTVTSVLGTTNNAQKFVVADATNGNGIGI